MLSSGGLKFFEALFDEGGILDAGQPRIEALLPDELVVRATLSDAAVFQHENLVGLADGAEPVRDDKRRATDHQPFKRLLNEPLGGGVDTGGGFIENQNRRIGQQRARDADALFLAHTKLHAAFAHACFVALVQRTNELMTIRGARGCFNGRVIGIEFAVLNIFANGSIEEEGI